MTTKTWNERAKEAIGQGFLTNSKNPDSDFPFVPSHWSSGLGAYLYDDKIGVYIDMICGLGAIHWGYNRLPRSFDPGLLSGCSTQEVKTAEDIKDFMPWVERVKFVNDGTEACLAAIRMARAYTGRNQVASEGYHGWSDEFIGLCDDSVGIPANLRFSMRKLDLDNLDEMTQVPFAAIIVEPVMLDDSPERIAQLIKLRKFCTARGIVLIFDEVITGLRYPLGSVATDKAIYPDLICCGKAFGNGEKTGFVAGRKELLDGPYFVSGTYFGQGRALRAISNSIERAAKDQSDVLCFDAKSANTIFNSYEPEIVRIDGWGTRGNFVGTDINVATYRQEMFKRRWYTKTTLVWNWANIQFAAKFLSDSKEVLEGMCSGDLKLEYELPVKGVAQRIREQAK
jgi:glutamate-1-semialdehyde aminotransferase